MPLRRPVVRTALVLVALATASLMLSLAVPVTSFDASAQPPSLLQDIDDDVPPGNPVIGDDRPGDIEPENDTGRYLLWGLVAICLIAAGTLLVKIERWESRRNQEETS